MHLSQKKLFGIIGSCAAIVIVVTANTILYPTFRNWSQSETNSESSVSSTTISTVSSTISSNHSLDVGLTVSISNIFQYDEKPFVLGEKVAFAVVALTSSEPFTISGTTVKDTHRVTVTYTPAFGDSSDSDTYTLKSFTSGDPTWKYAIGKNLKNLQPGLNEYVVKAWSNKEQLLDSKTLIIQNGTSEPVMNTTPEPNLLDVFWHEPQKVHLIDLYEKSTDGDRYMHHFQLQTLELGKCSLDGPQPFVSDKPFASLEVVKDEMKNLEIYEVGVVKSQEFEGAKIYATATSNDDCRSEPRTVKHFIQKVDGSFIALEAFGPMPLASKMKVDAGGPSVISIQGSKLTIKPCDLNGCGITSVKSKEKTIAPQSTLTNSPIYQGTDGCFEVARKDGFLEDYTLSLPLDIRWKDGSSFAPVYVSGQHYGCGITERCHWVYQGTTENLEHVGTTTNGLKVYQEKMSSQQLVAMASGSTTSYSDEISSLKDLYWSLPRYEGAKIPTPQEFVAQHPAIYVQDPLGRLLYFRAEQFGPAVECGKPVIYLYPKQEQDIVVQVEPTGGITISDPAYNNGWHVRATPEGDIYNYADTKKYPYLFWEGHGKNYHRPKRGFVVAKHEVPALLQEKLAALGLNEKEGFDFREFWEPKLMRSPYVFITFIDQDAFNTIAPLTIKPKPDSIIRVFMDYEPLLAPITVEPLHILTPKRTGFTVIEWGGALHKGGNGLCPGDTLLQ